MDKTSAEDPNGAAMSIGIWNKKLKKKMKTSAEDPNGAAMSIGMRRWRRRLKNIYKAAICGLPGEMPGYGGTLFNLFQT